MGLVILGIIILAIGFFSGKSQGPLTKFKGLFTLGGLIVIIIGFLISAVRIVQPGHVGIQILFGDTKDHVLYEGMSLVNPLVDIKEFSTRTLNYTMSSTAGEGSQMGDDAIKILSNDGLEVNIDLTILYRMIPTRAPSIYRTIGPNYQDVLIRPLTRTGIRNSAADFDAVELFAEKRKEFEEEIINSLQDTLESRGFVLEQILVRKIDLPESVKQSIERKITAIQESERMQYVLDKERQEADRKRVEAQGVADAQKILDAGLSAKVLEYERIKMQKELANSQNAKMIIMNGDQVPPIFMNSK
jgi:regulator of protease activity HflC (stomatin/prohibitin superfamily)